MKNIRSDKKKSTSAVCWLVVAVVVVVTVVNRDGFCSGGINEFFFVCVCVCKHLNHRHNVLGRFFFVLEPLTTWWFVQQQHNNDRVITIENLYKREHKKFFFRNEATSWMFHYQPSFFLSLYGFKIFVSLSRSLARLSKYTLNKDYLIFFFCSMPLASSS